MPEPSASSLPGQFTVKLPWLAAGRACTPPVGAPESMVTMASLLADVPAAGLWGSIWLVAMTGWLSKLMSATL